MHLETTFDRDVVRRHITVLVLTPTRLLIAHADDHADEPPAPAGASPTRDDRGGAALGGARGVMLTHVVEQPEAYVPGPLGRELTVTLGWGAVARVDLVPATCGDPDCDADHGYKGTVTADDIALRVSAAADGERRARPRPSSSPATSRPPSASG